VAQYEISLAKVVNAVLTQAHLSFKLMVSHYAPIHNYLHRQ